MNDPCVRVCDLVPDESDPTILRGRLGSAEVRVLPLVTPRNGATHCVLISPAGEDCVEPPADPSSVSEPRS